LSRLPGKRPGKPGGKRDENRRRKVEQLADAALGLFLEAGIAVVTIDQIVERAGVPKGSFYRYFRDKTELCETIVAPLADKVGSAMRRCATAIDGAHTPGEMPAVYLKLAADLSAAFLAHPREARLYLQEARAPSVGARAPIRRLADEVSRGAIALSIAAREHGFLRDTDPRVGALTVVGAAEHLLFAVLSGADLGAPHRIPVALVNVILNGVLAGPR